MTQMLFGIALGYFASMVLGRLARSRRRKPLTVSAKHRVLAWVITNHQLVGEHLWPMSGQVAGTFLANRDRQLLDLAVREVYAALDRGDEPPQASARLLRAAREQMEVKLDQISEAWSNEICDHLVSNTVKASASASSRLERMRVATYSGAVN